MTRILYLEPYSGIAGDMFSGSVIGLLENTEEYFLQINSLPIKDEFEVKIEKIVKAGITANRFDVILKKGHHHTHGHDSHHHGRHLSEIISIIEKAEKMAPEAKKTAIKIFNNLAEAESRVHGETIQKVHFHEVGAIDAIVDICSAAIIINLLKVDKIVSTPISVGTGTVKTSHGILPVPAPATALILCNLPINKTGIKSELTTPTGAAILKTLVNSWEESVKGKIIKSNYSAGTKDIKEITNIFRSSLIKSENKNFVENVCSKYQGNNDSHYEKVAVIECNIDDYAGEHFTYMEDVIFDAGALDYIIIPGTMKKSRPGIMLQIISPVDKLEEVTDTLLKHTSTNGIRFREECRIKLVRKVTLVDTPFGKVEVKLIYKNDKVIKAKPEQREIKRIALETGKSYIAILNEINYHIHSKVFS